MVLQVVVYESRIQGDEGMLLSWMYPSLKGHQRWYRIWYRTWDTSGRKLGREFGVF